MTKRTVIGALVAVALITTASPVVSSALSVDDVQTQIQALLARVRALTQQLTDLRANMGVQTSTTGTDTATVAVSSSPAAHPVCARLYRSIILGSQGEDVRSVQDFLKEQGYLNAEATGYFGILTRNALAQWQASQGITTSADVSSGAGTVGPRTIAYFKQWCGGGGGVSSSERFSATPQRGMAPLTVTFATWISGFHPNNIMYSIEYGDGTIDTAANCNAPADACITAGINTHTYTTDGTYTALLVKTTDICSGNPACMAPIQREVIDRIQIIVGASPIACTKEYRPVCGLKQVMCIKAPCNPVPQTYGNLCMLKADGATYAYDGACRPDTSDPASNPQCKSWYDGCNTCSRSTPGGAAMCTLRACMSDQMQQAYCTSHFDGTSGARAPVISSFSGPTTLQVGAQGTWTIQASDPENGTLSYRVSWGDERYATPMMSASGAVEAFVQSTTFTHAYAQAGVYTVTIIVRDQTGLEAKTTTTVKVGADAPTACTLEYAPVCGRPSGCANTCPPGFYCALMCQLHQPQTYSNSCFLKAAGAEVLHTGECTASDQ